MLNDYLKTIRALKLDEYIYQIFEEFSTLAYKRFILSDGTEIPNNAFLLVYMQLIRQV